ncbi:hypothetical protein PFDG_00463 [Plasmodium falciparum Dd2]|uniref:Rifin n=1 Tax=Plasmodium falciparum (isolate Dd2) TaxID=57267 RepID=A0A0L7LWT0_PLAF4|nr:hypothetical protein PFDG_00463 [Plasmodium falciparum Dd2]
MKFHYFNILLLNIPLNILIFSSHVYDKKNACNSTTPHVPKTKTTKIPTIRLLCECELYAPPNNDDPEMKALMQNFDRQTEQRFNEYEERMMKNRKKCKEQCYKDIQKIILKDKIEKELKKQLTTLETNIETNDIPTCICEKSLADKMEKTCLRCTQNLGGIVAPSSGVLGGIAELGISFWKPAALAAAKDAAIAEGAAAAKAAGEAARIAEGIKAVISGIEREFSVSTVGVEGLQSLFTAQNYNNVTKLALAINSEYNASSCIIGRSGAPEAFCSWVKGKFVAAKEIPGKVSSTYNSIEVAVKSIVLKAESVAETAAEKATEEAIKNSIAVVEAKYVICQNAIIASVGTLLIIVLVMIIIYLVLRYRRKNKMNKKAHYTKLLKE